MTFIRTLLKHRLFWKIMVIFWLTTFATILANILITKEIVVNEFKVSQLKEKMQALAIEATEQYEQEGAQSLRHWYRSLAKREGIRVILLHPDGTPVVRLRPKRHDDDHDDHKHDDRQERYAPPLEAHLLDLADHPVTSSTGQRYVLKMLPSRYLQSRFNPQALYAYRLLASFIIILIGSLWIARSIARPIRILHQASIMMSEGELDVRVSQHIGKRKDELGKLAQAFDQMADKVTSLLDSQQQLFRDISHEIRTPLTRQKLAIELARSSNPPNEMLNKIEQQNQCIEDLINQLLHFMQINHHQLSLDERLAPTEMLKACVTAAELELQAKQIALETEWNSVAFIKGDGALLTRAFDNLLINAIKYSPVQSTIRLKTFDQEQNIVIELSDEGPGIPEAELSSILKPFYRADKSRNRGTGGFGLGLAISAGIIERHGGSLRLHNRQEKGLLVSIIFPKKQH